MASNIPGPDPQAALPAGEGPLRLELARGPLIALTHDALLIETLRRVDAAHEVCAVSSELDLSTVLITHHAGAALLDCAALVSPIAPLTERLQAQFPELVLIVAGGVEEQSLLAEQITSGAVHRFLHKPFSEQRVRLFVEAAWRRHGEVLASPQSPPRPRRRGVRALALALGGAAAAVVTALLWFGTRRPEGALPVAPAPAQPPVAAGPDTLLESQQVHAERRPVPTSAAGASAAALQPAPAAAARAPNPPQTNSSDPRVADYLAKSRAALSQGHLLEPAQESARFYVDSARALAPDDADVQEARQDLIARLESEARQALIAQDATQAEVWTAAAADAGADPADVGALNGGVQQLHIHGDALTRLSHAFDQRLDQGRILEPDGDSARYYLAQLTATDPAAAATARARSAFGARLLDEARTALQGGDFAAADRWLTEARGAAADSGQIGALAAALSAARQQAQASYVSAGALTRTRYVAPQYPDAARQRGVEGWVDLEFTVGRDGAVSEVTVLGAEPAHVFDQAALAAVRDWRYQPVVRDGQSVSQRARVRVRFRVQS